MHSEPLYLLAATAALCGIVRLERARPTVFVLLWTGVAMAAALLTRTVGIVLLVPLAIAALRRRSAALLLPLAIVVLVWPYPAAAQRLLLMLIPILLAQAYLAMAALSARYAPRLAKLAPSLVVYGPLLLALPDAVRAAIRFIAPAAVDLVPFKHTDSWYLDDPHDIKDVSAWALVRWKPAAAASANQP